MTKQQEDRFIIGWERAIAHLSSIIMPIITEEKLTEKKKCEAIRKIFDDSIYDIKKITDYEKGLRKVESLRHEKYVERKND